MWCGMVDGCVMRVVSDGMAGGGIVGVRWPEVVGWVCDG